MRLSLRDLVMVPVMTAVVAALGLLPRIPVAFLPVPITMQTLGVMLAGIVLGARRGFLSQVLFLALVGVGAPMLAGGRGGFSVLVGPSAGFLWGWPLGAWLIGYLTERSGDPGSGKLFLYNMLGGIGVIYAIGIPVMAWVGSVPWAAATTGSLVFVPGDLLKAGLAAVLGFAIRRALRAAKIGPAGAGHAKASHAGD
ncbi:MAG TPA: biotin transporter BioY [Symbiobacteriaceae bacterium]|jgi:biotin transport system substrate-specific component